MNKIAIVCLTVCLFTACMPKAIPLKGSYPETPISYKTTNSFDQVWDKLIDLFAQTGFSIKLIDRSSGLIVSEGKMPVTIEDKDGNLTDKAAYIAVTKEKGYLGYLPTTGAYRTYEHGKSTMVFFDIVGEWNVRIKPIQGGGASININIVNTRTQPTEVAGKLIQSRSVTVRSTGVFEKSIYDLIK